METTTPTTTAEISRRIRMEMAGRGLRRIDLRSHLSKFNSVTGKDEPMPDSTIGRRLAGEHPWDLNELAVVCAFLEINMHKLTENIDLPDLSEPTLTEES